MLPLTLFKYDLCQKSKKAYFQQEQNNKLLFYLIILLVLTKIKLTKKNGCNVQVQSSCLVDLIKMLYNNQQMGQCQTQKSQQKIDMFHIYPQDLRSDIPLQTCLYQYPLRNIKIEEVREQIIMENMVNGLKCQTVTFTGENDNSIQLQCKKYDYLSPGLIFQHQGLQIQQILLDELHCDRIIYLVKKSRLNYSMTIRHFKGYESRQFINAIYEINNYEIIGSLKSPYLHKIVKNYTIQSTNQFVPHHSKVIIFEPVTANLSLIIKHRRALKKPWLATQFYVLMMNLVEGLATLHEAGLVHTDIRPSNVFYCHQRHQFMLGSFSNIILAQSPPQEGKRRQGAYKDAKKRKGSFHISSIQEDNRKSDVYSLGMTLLAAFYLILLIDRKKAAPYNREYDSDYPILQIIAQMVCKIQKRKNIFEIKQLLNDFVKLNNLTSIRTVELQDYSTVSKDYIDMYKRERFIADGYKMLGLVSNWKERLKNRQIHKKISDNSVESAKYYEELAVISSIQGKIEKSKNYYIHSAEIYYKVGTNNFIERDFQNAAIYFQEGLDNFRIIQNKQSHLTYLKLLMSLYQTKIVSGYELVDSQQLRRVQQLVLEVKKVQPFAFWQYGVQLISIYKYYQNYNKIRELLQMCRQVSGNIETKIGPITLEKMVIQNNLKLADLKSNQNSLQRRAILTQTELSIFSLLNDKQYYFISHPLQKIQLNLLSSKLKLQKGATRDAITILQELVASSLEKDQQLDDAHKNRYSLLKCQVFAELGHIWLQLQELGESFKYFSKAVQNYKQYYGDIYNIECALLIQKMAEVYKRKKKHIEYTDSMNLVLKILKTEYGKYHKDILRLNYNHKKQLRQDKQLTLSSLHSRRISESDLESIASW